MSRSYHRPQRPHLAERSTPANLSQRSCALTRSVKRPRCTPADRTLLVFLASRVRLWRHALLIVQPETLLRWHRQGFRLFWRSKSQAVGSTRKAKISAETIALIREMAAANRLWGAERIRGELLKLDIRVAKWTIQKYMRRARPPRRSSQTWATFPRTHRHQLRRRRAGSCSNWKVEGFFLRRLRRHPARTHR